LTLSEREAPQGESTGVCFVKLESNCDVSSSLDSTGLREYKEKIINLSENVENVFFFFKQVWNPMRGFNSLESVGYESGGFLMQQHYGTSGNI
jgi:hypothetical protein